MPDGAAQALERLERRVDAQFAALAAVPISHPVPRSVIALLALAPHELDGVEVPPQLSPRLSALFDRVRAMADELSQRQADVERRLIAIKTGRRSGQAGPRLDCRT